MRQFIRSLLKLAATGLVVITISGCATGPNANPQDPLEPFNRQMFALNEELDKTVAKPVATVYKTVTPNWFQIGVSNFFNNLEDIWSIANNLAQGRGERACQDFSRVFINSTLGVLGLIDVASNLNIPRYPTDFSITLGRWGVESGPYIVLPLLGASTLRNVAALPFDQRGTLFAYMHDDPGASSALATLNVINKRSRYLGAGDFLSSIALDPYVFMRDAYLQQQKNLVEDGRSDSTQTNPASLSQSIAPISDWLRMGHLPAP